jgi:type VI secretion system secreted protein Hcp
MSHNIYLKVSGVDGEVTEKGYEKNMGVLSFSHGVSMPINRNHTNVSSPSGTPTFQDFTFTMYLDSTHPLWNARVSGGANIATADLTVLESDTDAAAVVPLYTINFKNIIVSSVSIGGGIGDKPVVTISFVFHSIKWTYSKHKQVNPGGTPGQVPAGFDLQLNKPL